jgi:hypothetical protein
MKLYHPLRKIVYVNTTFDDLLKKLGRTHHQYKSFKDSIEGVTIGSTNTGVVTPFDGPSYNEARAESDPAFNIYPYLIVYCSCTSDVINAVNFARMEPLIKVCIRSGGKYILPKMRFERDQPFLNFFLVHRT